MASWTLSLTGAMGLWFALAPGMNTPDAHAAEGWVKTKEGCVLWNFFPHGKPSYSWSGKCANGKAHGKGRLVIRHVVQGVLNTDRYKVEYKRGIMEGFGEIEFHNGSTYAGYFRANKKQGHGKYRWPNGVWYAGNYVDNQRHGQGEVFLPRGAGYIGPWRNGRQHGTGKCYRISGAKKLTQTCRFKNGKRIR
ncbi:MAG: hypothetical protein AAF441_00570 [Pseudomonadota bacterium]